MTVYFFSGESYLYYLIESGYLSDITFDITLDHIYTSNPYFISDNEYGFTLDLDLLYDAFNCTLSARKFVDELSFELRLCTSDGNIALENNVIEFSGLLPVSFVKQLIINEYKKSTFVITFDGISEPITLEEIDDVWGGNWNAILKDEWHIDLDLNYVICEHFKKKGYVINNIRHDGYFWLIFTSNLYSIPKGFFNFKDDGIYPLKHNTR
tara:strand:+ start:569 stop:1198 length:630 start_codon:yes stop_codon:yes gene_type:complete